MSLVFVKRSGSSAKEIDDEREVKGKASGCLVEAPGLLNNSFAGDRFSCYSDDESKHCCETIKLLVESFG